jgi:hypothetical protein
MSFFRLLRFYRQSGMGLRNAIRRAWDLSTRDLTLH